MNGVRVKARSGDSGTIKDITYQDITISGITEYVFFAYLSFSKRKTNRPLT